MQQEMGGAKSANGTHSLGNLVGYLIGCQISCQVRTCYATCQKLEKEISWSGRVYSACYDIVNQTKVEHMVKYPEFSWVFISDRLTCPNFS